MGAETTCRPSILYRFISEGELMRLIAERSFVLKRPSLWKDEWEGFPFKLLDNAKGKKLVESYFRKHRISFASDIVQLLKNTIYCLCFTRTAEDQSIWGSYSYDRRGLRISIDRATLESFIPPSPLFQLKEVDYADKRLLRADLSKYLKQIVYRDGPNNVKVKPFNGYILKRTEFAHENEVRLLHYEPKNLLAWREEQNQKVYLMGRNGIQAKTTLSDTLSLPFPVPIESIVTSIMVHPECDDLYLSIIEKLCVEHNIHFEGRSRLYKLDDSSESCTGDGKK